MIEDLVLQLQHVAIPISAVNDVRGVARATSQVL